jgi:hypothetical protein
MMQQELAIDCWQVGALLRRYRKGRLIELPGSPSQRCGVLVGWRLLAGVPDVLYPVVLWDSGVMAYSSAALGLRRLQDEEQLRLLVCDEVCRSA